MLALLPQAGRPLTAYEVLKLLRPNDAAATPANVYRGLDVLLRRGLAHRLETTRAYVACGHPQHPHAGQFLTLDERVPTATGQLGHCLGFASDQCMVEVTGVCGQCQG